MNASSQTMAVIACDVLGMELHVMLHGLDHVREHVQLPMGLHDRPDVMRRELQSRIDSYEGRDDIDTLVLVFGLCGHGTAGLVARSKPLVIARAHDCVTFWMGSKERYLDYQKKHPDAYYYTPGWMRGKRLPGKQKIDHLYKSYAAQFDDSDDVEFLVGLELDSWRQRGRAAYLDFGGEGADARRAYVESCAEWLGWPVDEIEGDDRLLHDLFNGNWDNERFLTVAPGEMIKPTADESIVRAEPCRSCALCCT